MQNNPVKLLISRLQGSRSEQAMPRPGEPTRGGSSAVR